MPLQTLANRLSETRRALGAASDGRPRLRKQGRRHLIVEAETDWDRFKQLASRRDDPDSWRSALALVRGRPFDGLDRGEWARLEGHAAAIEASVIEVACRLGKHASVVVTGSSPTGRRYKACSCHRGTRGSTAC